nr:MAG TPA: minor tail protein [Bacteriophage sp.]
MVSRSITESNRMNTMAESNADIVAGMERSAAALAAVGTSTADAFSLFSSINEVLQNAEKSGTALRSVALRIRSFDESTEEYSSDLANITGELADLTKTAEHSQGVSIFKEGSTTEFKSLVDYFGQIADIWDEMSQKQQNDFLIKAFGRTQAQAGAALIQNYKGVTKALDEMGKAAGSSDKEMETVRSSLSYKANALKETWTGIAQNLIDRGTIGTAIDFLTKASEAVDGLTKHVDLLSIALGGIAGYLSLKNNVGRDRMYSLFFEYADNIHNLLWIQRFRVC